MAEAVTKQVIQVVYEKSQAERDAEARSRAEIRRVNEEAVAVKKAAKEKSDSEKKAAKETADEQKKQAKEAADEQKKQAKDATEDQRKRRKELADLVKSINSEIKAANKILDDADKQIDAAKKERDEARRRRIRHQIKDTEEGAAKAKEVDAAFLANVKSIGLMGAAMVGLGSASAVLTTVWQRIVNIRRASVEGADDINRRAASMRSLSSMTNQMGSPSAKYVDVLKMTGKTFQTPEEARAMLQATMARGYGAVEAGLISEAELKRAAEFQGRRQVMIGESPEAMDDVLGLLSSMMGGKKGQTAEDVEALNQRLFELIRLGGYKSYTQGVGQLERSSEYVQKGIYSAPMAMALTSAFAHSGPPEEAAQKFQQATRAVTVGMMRNRGMKVLPEEQDQFMRTAAYFKTLRDAQGKPLSDQTAPEDRLMAVVADVMRAEDEAHKSGKKFYATDYLSHKGFVNQEDMLALAALSGVKRSGMLDQLMAKGRAPVTAQAAGAGINAEWDKFGRDPVGAEIIAERQIDLAEQAAFAKDRFRNIQFRAAYGRMGGMAKFGYKPEEMMTWWNSDPREITSQSRELIEINAQREILAQARKSGVDLPDRLGVSPRGAPHFLGWERLFDISQKTAERGGRVLPGPDSAVMDRNTKAIEDNTRALMGQPPAPAPVGAAGQRQGAPPAALPAAPRPWMRMPAPAF
jgi:hypothetical protein